MVWYLMTSWRILGYLIIGHDILEYQLYHIAWYINIFPHDILVHNSIFRVSVLLGHRDGHGEPWQGNKRQVRFDSDRVGYGLSRCQCPPISPAHSPSKRIDSLLPVIIYYFRVRLLPVPARGPSPSHRAGDRDRDSPAWLTARPTSPCGGGGHLIWTRNVALYDIMYDIRRSWYYLCQWYHRFWKSMIS